MLRHYAASLLELISPSRCIGCGMEGSLPMTREALGFCGGCAPLLEPLDEPVVPGVARAAFVYGGPLADAIHRMKYRGESEVADVLGARMLNAAQVYAGRVDGVVPIPLHPKRLRSRGYNQSALLGRVIARGLGVPMRVDLLSRSRDTAAQVDLARVDRLANMRGAFVAAKQVEGRGLLLLDDVTTTGATLAAASHALMARGAEEVLSFALARG